MVLMLKDPAARRRSNAERQERNEKAAALVQRAAGGDRSALDELFRRYKHVLYRIVDRILGFGHRNRDDVVQDALLAVLTHFHQYEERACFEAWLATIARNCALEEQRRQREIPSEIADDPRDVADAVPDDDASHARLASLEVAL